MAMSVLARSFRATLLQPAFLFCLSLEAGIVAFLLFAVDLVVDHGAVVAVTIAGSKPLGIAVFVRQMLPLFSGGLLSAVIFLFMLVGSGLVPDLLNDPVLPIVLTKRVSRRRLYLLHLLGAGAAFGAGAVILSFGICVVVSAKAGTSFFWHACAGAALFGVLLLVFLSLASLFGMFLKNATTTLLLLLGLHFVISPLLTSVRSSHEALVDAALLVIPATSTLQAMVSDLFLGNPGQPAALVQPVLVVIVCLAAGGELFHRRDF